MKRFAFIALVALTCFDASAFKLQAMGVAARPAVETRQAMGFLSLFGSDVHERIMRQAYEKAGAKLTDDVIAGVRWNDNPPIIRMGPLAGTCDVACWVSMLRVDNLALEILSKREQSIPTLRSHFGDMQFLHAMASRAGEKPADTREKALRWLEFSYRVSRGEIGPRVNVFSLREAGSEMDAATRDWVSSLFRAPDKQLWLVQDVFLPGVGDLKHVAFGTFLHVVQDSYSASHVRRLARRTQSNGCPSYDASDPIAEFHTYVGQDTEKHALCDDSPDWLDSPREGSPVDVMAELVRAYTNGRDWPGVKAIIEEKVLKLADATRPARPGTCFEAPPQIDATDAVREHPAALPKGCEPQ
jgi:hypothetical protein